MAIGLSWWKNSLLQAYLYGSLPLRRFIVYWLARKGRTPVAILFYHRVSDRIANDWTITNRRFSQHIRWLERHVDFVSLEEAQRRVRHGHGGRMAVSITFDDGYADNCEWALPLLIRKQIPITYFVSTDHVLRGQPFPHDAAAGCLLAPNTVAQLRYLAENGVAIGTHTRTHVDLGTITDSAKLTEEIVTPREELREAVGCQARYFAFPYGLPENISPLAIRVAREAGYEAICSAFGGYNFPRGNAFHLRRFHADRDFVRFKNWLTLDPRKLDHARRWPRTSDDESW